MNKNLTIYKLISDLLVREGGYVNNPADRGGPTNMGITQKTLSNWRGYPCTAQDVENLKEMEARTIYHEIYWVRPGFHQIDLSPVVIEMIFDTGVHSGPGRAVKLLQKAIAVTVDGSIGPVTRQCAHRLGGQRLASLFIGERVAYLGRLIEKDRTQAEFAAGWMARMREFIIDIPQA
jgi:lysozyme family protein